MQPQLQAGGGNPPVFHVIEKSLDTVAEARSEDIVENIRHNMERDIPRLHHRIDFGKTKGKTPLAIVAGGPSLRTTMHELCGFDDIMVVGSTHDFLVSDFAPKYAVVCDPSPVAGDYIQRPVHGCCYMLSSSADPALFDRLLSKGHDVCMWNCSSGLSDPLFKGEPAIQGGCTVTLRAINMAIVLGYYDIHLFGFDSSFPDDENHHAYSHAHETSERILVRVGGDNGRVFLTTPGWLAQATHFQEQLKGTGMMFHPTVHGDGLIAEIMRCAEEMAKQ